MPVNTKKVQDRRKVRYESLDELLADAQRFSGDNVRKLGNWSQGQIYEHIARSLDSSIGPTRAPWCKMRSPGRLLVPRLPV